MSKISVTLRSLLTLITLLFVVNSAHAIHELDLEGNYIASYTYDVYPQDSSYVGKADVWETTVIYQNYVLISISYDKIVDNGANTTQSDAELAFKEDVGIGACKRNVKYCPKN